MKEKIIREKGNISIIRRNIGISKSGKSISGPHGRAGDMNKTEIKVLKEHHPTGLVMR